MDIWQMTRATRWTRKGELSKILALLITILQLPRKRDTSRADCQREMGCGNAVEHGSREAIPTG
jgi:hypothetical protein